MPPLCKHLKMLRSDDVDTNDVCIWFLVYVCLVFASITTNSCKCWAWAMLTFSAKKRVSVNCTETNFTVMFTKIFAKLIDRAARRSFLLNVWERKLLISFFSSRKSIAIRFWLRLSSNELAMLMEKYWRACHFIVVLVFSKDRYPRALSFGLSVVTLRLFLKCPSQRRCRYRCALLLLIVVDYCKREWGELALHPMCPRHLLRNYVREDRCFRVCSSCFLVVTGWFRAYRNTCGFFFFVA